MRRAEQRLFIHFFFFLPLFTRYSGNLHPTFNTHTHTHTVTERKSHAGLGGNVTASGASLSFAPFTCSANAELEAANQLLLHQRRWQRPPSTRLAFHRDRDFSYALQVAQKKRKMVCATSVWEET